MTLKVIILNALLSLPVSKHDIETVEQREVRMTEVADGIAQAADEYGTTFRSKSLVAASLISVGWYESNFSQPIGENRCHELGKQYCDGGKAVGYWQSWSAEDTETVAEWASRAAAHLNSAANHCGAKSTSSYDLVYRSVSLYATGNRCSWRGAHLRARMAMKYLKRL